MDDLGAEFSKTKTLDAGVRIFNGAVRAEREFPLKILFLACIRGFSVLLILRNGDQNPLSRSPKGTSAVRIQSIFCSHPAGTITDNSKFNKQKTKTELFRLLLTVHPISAFETEKNPRFQTTAQNTFLCQSIKFCLLFSCLNLKL